MAYYHPSLEPESDPQQQLTNAGPKIRGVLPQLWDMLRAAPAGAWQGFGGKNLSYEQWRREKLRSRRGRPPGRYPGRGPLSWLERVLR